MYIAEVKARLIALLIFIQLPLFGQQKAMIGFYNCENLFDTIHDPFKKDYEYLPGNKKDWNTEKYLNKLHSLARVILAMNNWKGPDVLGLCEVENNRVLYDLIQLTSLKKFGYQFVHYESKDLRGVDVACIYKKKTVSVIHSQAIEVKFDSTARPTRDILYLKILPNRSKDTLNIFFNHWPSRYGGQARSDHKRVFASNVLKSFSDSLQKNNSNSKIVVLGDLNDGPENESVRQLCATDSTSGLINVSKEWKEATHKYKGQWEVFDHVLVNKNVKVETSSFFKASWMMENDFQYYGKKPKRTYAGFKYLGGFSDHLPVYLKIDLSK